MTTVPAGMVGRAVDRVFAGEAYQRSTKTSLFELAWTWLVRQYLHLVDVLAHTPGASMVVRITIYTLVVLVVAMVTYRVSRHYRASHDAGRVRFGSEHIGNLWNAAERSAGQGNYTEAAHLVYAALIHSLAQRGVVHFHPSKTTGDYLREVHRGTSRTNANHANANHANASRVGVEPAQGLSEFIRAYEIVAYRDGTCDAERYATLRALAMPVVHAQRETRRAAA